MKYSLVLVGLALAVASATPAAAQMDLRPAAAKAAPAPAHKTKKPKPASAPAKEWSQMDADERMGWAAAQAGPRCRQAFEKNPQSDFWRSVARGLIMSALVTPDYVLEETRKRCAELLASGTVDVSQR